MNRYPIRKNREMRGHEQPCEYCKREMRCDVAVDHPLRATRDHYMPKSRRRGDDAVIIVMACFTCNQAKGDRFPEQWDRFMQCNPNWWGPRGERQPIQAPPQPPKKPNPPPYDHTMYILKHGLKAYRKWLAAGCPVIRPLRKDEPAPHEFDDPEQQAIFESYARKYHYLMRVPTDAAP